MTNTQSKNLTGTAAACAALLWAGMALATTPPETSLNNCQNAVKTTAAKFVKNKVTAIGTCLQAVSAQIVKENAPDASKAAAICVAGFRKLYDSRNLGLQLSDKLAAAISAKCSPGGSNTHTLGESSAAARRCRGRSTPTTSAPGAATSVATARSPACKIGSPASPPRPSATSTRPSPASTRASSIG